MLEARPGAAPALCDNHGVLRLTDLRKSYGNLVAVDGVSLEIRRGEVFGLLGPNGAGKSTTIGMCVGLLRPDSGTVEIEGVGAPTVDRVRRNLGVAPQALAIYDQLTGRENVMLLGRLYGLGGKELQRRVDAALDVVGLLPRSMDRAGKYSGGMKRRLNLAAAMVHDPPLLLLDEPTAGVDPQSRNNILDTVRSLAQRGVTVVYTTHYMEEAQRLCDRVGIMDKGRVLCIGTVEDLVGRFGGKTVVRVRRGVEDERIETENPLCEISRVLEVKEGREAVTGVSLDPPDLESVFLSMTGRSLRD
jgi:ABC-2 type transport system ATP-binding protein